MNEFDVLVVGAGMAGLTAARAMAESGLRVKVLEASERVGGRIRTVRTKDAVVELGAEFVHGRPAELVALIAEAGLTLYERTGEFLQEAGGTLTEGDGDDRLTVLEGLKDYVGEDCSFATYAGRLELGEEERGSAVGYVEGFNAADAREASVLALGRQQRAEDEIDGDRVWRVREGYSRVTGYVWERAAAAGAHLEFGVQVVEIGWRPGAVEVRDQTGRMFKAGRVVIAVPLGVLQGGGIVLEPQSGQLKQGLAGLGMGEARRFTMVFRRRMWPEEMSFLLAPDRAVGVWWTARPEESATLTGWIGGPRATAWRGVSESDARQRVVKIAAEALGLTESDLESELEGFHTFDWSSDDRVRGAYSWVKTGGIEAADALSEPVAATLYVAGEHTDVTGHWGTVHGAMRSGLRVAEQVLRDAHARP